MLLTPRQSVTIRVNDTVVNLDRREQHLFVINRLQTVYVRSRDDLTGTKVVTNKPVSLFSGHECADIQSNPRSCDYLIEQIPPTTSWGRVYYTVPLATRRSYIIKILAAYDSTRVVMFCNKTVSKRSYSAIFESDFINRVLHLQEHCSIQANKEVLVVQISYGHRQDGIGDPMMTLLPANIHYSNEFSFSTIHNQMREGYTHFVNIIVMAQYYQPDMIYLIARGVSKSLDTQEWVPVNVNNVTEAYVTKLTISEGVVEIIHTNTSALITTVVYGFVIGECYGHPGGLHTNTGLLRTLFALLYGFSLTRM